MRDVPVNDSPGLAIFYVLVIIVAALIFCGKQYDCNHSKCPAGQSPTMISNHCLCVTKAKP